MAGFGAVLAVSSLFNPAMLLPFAGSALLAARFCWNAALSIVSDPVELRWDEQRLLVKPAEGLLTIDIGSAQWVYRERTNIVIRFVEPTPKFNSGHVRCSGREITIDGFLGTTPEGLSDIAKKLGPEKSWLWRYMPI
jgi:hypothetical protein